MALVHRIYYRSDGGVSIMLMPKDPEEFNYVAKVWAERRDIVGFDDFSESEFNTMYPKDANGKHDRKDRDKFRRHPSGRGFFVDPSVKTKKEEIAAEIASANTIPEIKAILAKYVLR